MAPADRLRQSTGRITQPSFTAGEIAPELYARKDLAKYQVGVRLLENMYVQAYGGVSNRPGLKYVTRVKNSAKNVRLGKFETSGDQAYVIEMGDQYFRYFYRGGAVVDGSSVIVETVTPYSDDEVNDLYSAQSNDVLTLVHPNYSPRELTRPDPSTFTLSSFLTFQPSTTAPTGVTATGTQGYTGYGSDKLPETYVYKVSTIGADGDESLPSVQAVADIPLVLGYEQNFVTITWSAVTGATGYNVYKRQNGVYGYIGFTDGDLSFKDTNFAPDFADGPVKGQNPFASGSDNKPTVVSFCQQRRVFAATLNKPQTIWMTQSGNYQSLSVSSPAKDDDAVSFTLAAQQKQDIYHVVALEKGMIVFTISGEWRVTGRDGDVITPSSILPEPQSYYGASPILKPIIAGEQLLFVPQNEKAVMEMEYSIQVDRYHANNLALLSGHLFKKKTIVAWDFAAQPDGIVWCVMSDGTALSLTYLKEHDIWGWGRHNTKGKFLDVVCVSERYYDTPYFIVERLDHGVYKKNIEFLPQRDVSSLADCFFVDAGLTYRVQKTITGVSGQHRVTIPAHGFPDGSKVKISSLDFLDDDGNEVARFDGIYTVYGGDANSFALTDGAIDVDFTPYSGYYLNLPAFAQLGTDTVTGLDHLAGRDGVTVVADGFVLTKDVRNSGRVDLGAIYFVVHVGLGYTSQVWTLDMVNPQQDTVGIKKAVPRVFVNVLDSRGFAIGPTPDAVQEPGLRTDENYDVAESLHSDTIELDWMTDWDTLTAVAVVQKYPLPLTVLAVTVEQVYGG